MILWIIQIEPARLTSDLTRLCTRAAEDSSAFLNAASESNLNLPKPSTKAQEQFLKKHFNAYYPRSSVHTHIRVDAVLMSNQCAVVDLGST